MFVFINCNVIWEDIAFTPLMHLDLHTSMTSAFGYDSHTSERF